VKIGIGIPNTVPGTPGATLVEWARQAEKHGFAGLATIDRFAYPNYDSLATLAAAAAVTSHIGLLTNILLAPAYPPLLLAKSAASIDQISGGRFTLGVAPGGREDDFAAVGRPFHRRGRDFDAGLEEMHRIWAGEPRHSPTPVGGGGVPLMFGGDSDASIRRTVKYGQGWTMGGGMPDQAGEFAARVRQAWHDGGREGEPRIAALAYYSLGDDAEQDSRAYLNDYYAFLGPYAGMIADGALRSPDAIRGAVKAFEAAGVTELYLDPTVARLDQLERLAEVVL
jgi:alkanesulfonate monooxygenase SsuD/methylene tetrahydromethanopterin reductase-like flavin-dependent oxidoreductase (luciferase family)